MCLGGSKSSPPPAPPPPAPVINPSLIGDPASPHLQTADELMDEEAKKKLKKKIGTSSLNTQLTSGLNIGATSSGVNIP